MVGITPLSSQVPDKAPITRRIKIEGTAAPIVSVILSEILSQLTPLLRAIHIATKADSISAN